jgi:rsbT co-antagonist protein RsbR
MARPDAAAIMAIYTLHEDLAYREEERAEAVAEIGRLNAELKARVKMQSQAILELSTPVIQIWDEVVVLPLIRAVDTMRARQILEHALQAAQQLEASVFIIDITGVPIVDTAVANHLLMTIQALKMLGAESILTGVSPANAHTLVKLGADLSAIPTKGTLQAGLRLAQAMVRT